MDDRLKPARKGQPVSAKQQRYVLENLNRANSAPDGSNSMLGFNIRAKTPFWMPSTSSLQRHSRQELYLAIPEFVDIDDEEGPHFGERYFGCRVYWQDNETYPWINPDWWITPAGETKKVYIAKNADWRKVKLHSSYEDGDILVVLGNYSSSAAPSSLALGDADGYQQKWTGNFGVNVINHPGDCTVYAQAKEGGPLQYLIDHPQNHLERMTLCTAWFAPPTNGGADWKIPLVGNRQTGTFANSTSWVNFRTNDIEVVWQVPPRSGYSVFAYYELESDWDYMWIDTVGGISQFPAVITGHAAIGGDFRWRYTFAEIEYEGDDYGLLAGGRTGSYAINRSEFRHTDTYAWGIDVTGVDYPDGFAPRPVGGGGVDNNHKYNVVVMMEGPFLYGTDEDAHLYYYFNHFGSHDGTCESSEEEE